MTKPKYWLSILALSVVLIAGSLAVGPVAIADDDDDDDNGEDCVECDEERNAANLEISEEESECIGDAIAEGDVEAEAECIAEADEDFKEVMDEWAECVEENVCSPT